MSFRVRGETWLLFWLALRLGKTVGQLEQELTEKEFQYWKLFYIDLCREPIPN